MAARTCKMGILKNKNKQAKSVSVRFKNPRISLSLQDAKDSGVVIAIENPNGNTYHWFARGRKCCYETKMKWDKDGYRYYKNNAEWLYSKQVMPSWVRKRMYKVSI